MSGPPSSLHAPPSSAFPIPWPENAPLKHYSGSCHCGNYAFEFECPNFDGINEGEQMQVMSCNCSICSRKGYLLVYVPVDKFRFTTGSLENLSKYFCSTKTVAHTFCAKCGCAFVEDAKVLFAVNVRTVKGIDLSTLKLKYHNGADVSQ